MTICIATPEYLPMTGGIATFYENLIEILALDGHTIILLTIDEINSEEADVINESENIIFVTLRKSFSRHYNQLKKKSAKDFLYVAAILAGARAMRDWLKNNHKKYKIDIVETIDANGYGYFLIDSELPPVVVCGHGSLFQSAKFDFTLKDKRYQLITYLEKQALQNADVVITHSPLNQQSLQKECSIEVLFATAPWQKKETLKNLASIKQHQVLVIGRLQTLKGVKVVIETLIKNKNTQHPFKINWVGGDTYTAPYGSLWSKYLRRKHPEIWQKDLLWQNSITRQELKTLLFSIDIVIIPSVWEVFGYAAVEAASLGKCIIISSGAGSSYLFDDKKNAMIIPSEDSDALLSTIQKLLIDKKLRLKLSENVLKLPDEKLKSSFVIKERMSAYNYAIEQRKEKIRFDIPKDFQDKNLLNLKLPVSYYFKKTILKIMARI